MRKAKKNRFENERRDGKESFGGICSPEAKILLHYGQRCVNCLLIILFCLVPGFF